MALKVGQVAKAAGMAAKTIRYYEQVGVLPPPSRTAAGYRQYGEQAVQQLMFIRRARALGLSLHHLKTLTAALDGGPRAAMRPRLREAFRAHLSAVQRQMLARTSVDCRCLQNEDLVVPKTDREAV